MAQVTQTGTRFYVGITEVESSVKCVQKREYSRNIDTIEYTTLRFYWPRANDVKMW